MDSTTLLFCNPLFLLTNSLRSCSAPASIPPRRSFKPIAIQASAGKEAISLPNHVKSKNLYEVLQINPAATAKEIKRAYRRLAREFHPDHVASPQDKNKNTQMFLNIHNAYVTLSDSCDRAGYDRQLSAQMRVPIARTMSNKSFDRGEAIYGYSCDRRRKGRSWETDQCW